MTMDELEQIRAQKIAALKEQYGDAQESQAGQAELQQQVAMLEEVVKHHLDAAAISRLGTLKLAHPEKALQAMWGLEGKAIFSEGENSLIDEANGKLNDAVELSNQPGLESQTNAKALLAEAILSFQESQKVVSTSVYKTADFVFNKEQAGILLNAAGISGLAGHQAVGMIGRADPKRQLQILKVVDNNNEYYRALIVVSFSLDVNILADSNAGDRVLQVIEVVPKEFAEYAAELDSNIAFDVLYDDPKLSFTLTRDEYKKKGFSYAFKNNLSQLQADTLISGNVVNKFVAPPILLPIGTVTAGLAISSDFMLYAVVAIIIINPHFIKSNTTSPASLFLIF